MWVNFITGNSENFNENLKSIKSIVALDRYVEKLPKKNSKNIYCYKLKQNGEIDFKGLKIIIENHTPEVILLGDSFYDKNIDFSKLRKYFIEILIKLDNYYPKILIYRH